jgi:tetratricopeptide (TPR) repeat protein
VTWVRTLVAAFAHFDEGEAAKHLSAALARRAADASDVALDEGYVDGIACYLHDPAAYELPPRRRPAAAALLWRLVPRIAPRWSSLDGRALEMSAYEYEQAGDAATALAEYRRSLLLADVEDAVRSPATKLLESARLRAFEAREAAAAGRAEDALGIARSIRAPDPSNGDLAFRAGWTLVKLGRVDEEAEAALRDAVARDDKDAPPPFWAGYVVEVREGPAKAIPLYQQAMNADLRGVSDARGEYLTHRRGRRHRWGHYPHWLARASVRAGVPDADVLPLLRDAVLADDRIAGEIRRDPAFGKLAERDRVLAETLDEFPSEPLR